MTIKKGDIFVATWGYDQTNATFFQVIGTTGKSVVVRQIEKKETPDEGGFMTGNVTPIRNKFMGEAKTKRLQDNKYFGIGFRAGDSYGFAEKWDGEPVAVSHYA